MNGRELAEGKPRTDQPGASIKAPAAGTMPWGIVPSQTGERTLTRLNTQGFEMTSGNKMAHGLSRTTAL